MRRFPTGVCACVCVLCWDRSSPIPNLPTSLPLVGAQPKPPGDWRWSPSSNSWRTCPIVKPLAAVRSRIDWKYLLGLDLMDPGFDHSILCEFRERLLAGAAATRLLEASMEVGRQPGWITVRGQQRTDSTHVLMTARTLNRLEGVGETLRAALNALAASAPEWLCERVPAEWFDRYSHRIEDYRLPKGEAARQASAEQMGADGVSTSCSG
jgi:hypothetical protein